MTKPQWSLIPKMHGWLAIRPNGDHDIFFYETKEAEAREYVRVRNESFNGTTLQYDYVATPQGAEVYRVQRDGDQGDVVARFYGENSENYAESHAALLNKRAWELGI